MIRNLFTLFFICCVCVLADTSQDIASNSKTLENKNQLEKNLTRELEEISKTLQQEESSLKKTESDIESVEREIGRQQSLVDSIKGEVNTLSQSNKELLKEQKEIENHLINIIAKDFSYLLVLDRDYLESYEGVITDEALKHLGRITNDEFTRYSNEYAKAAEKIKYSNSRLKTIKNLISELENKKKNLATLKADKTKIIASVEKEQKEYTARIKALQSEKAELKKTLETLQIMKKDADSAKNTVAIPDTFDNVRQLGSSYQAGKVKTYNGAKTISPLAKYTVQQKFGDYIDPVYNIKIFNESVVLRSPISNDEVKSVLDGKVVFAKETNLLKNVIIIENAGGIHTIYAHLSRIAPTIQVGDKIKKGYVIGRVDRDLTFEVTQQNYHINPLEMIVK